jgi:hypothetical protein
MENNQDPGKKSKIRNNVFVGREEGNIEVKAIGAITGWTDFWIVFKKTEQVRLEVTVYLEHSTSPEVDPHVSLLYPV